MTNYVHIIALNERKFGNTSFQTAYKRRISNFFYKKKKARNFDCSKCIKMISGKPFPIARHKITINISAYDSP